jgi:hypothetical protein
MLIGDARMNWRAIGALSVLTCMLAGTCISCGSSSSTPSPTGAASLKVKDPVPGTCSNSVLASNQDICPAASNPAVNCSQAQGRPGESCGVLIKVATESSGTPIETLRTSSSSVKEYGGEGAVDTSCFEKANWKMPGNSQMVTMKGFARNFSNGCESAGVIVEVYTVKPNSGGELGNLVGSAVTVAGGTCEAADEQAGKCKRFIVEGKCTEGNERIYRSYEYPNVPTETELVVKSFSNDGAYAALYDYNVYISNDKVTNGIWDHDVRAVVSGDYTLIPTVAFGRNITKGNGSVAGEIHDCGDVRVNGVSVDVSTNRFKVGYFTDNEDTPLPDPNRTSGTSLLGLYSAYDIPPGPVRVSAVGVVDGKLVNMGFFDARIFPDAITAVTLRGLRPFQAQAASKLRNEFAFL